MKALAKEKDMLEREKWDLRRQTKEATEHTGMLRSQLDLKENRIKELEAELAMVRQEDRLTGVIRGELTDRQAGGETDSIQCFQTLFTSFFAIVKKINFLNFLSLMAFYMCRIKPTIESKIRGKYSHQGSDTHASLVFTEVFSTCCQPLCTILDILHVIKHRKPLNVQYRHPSCLQPPR